jgi:signal transduction histidine kinase
VKNSFEKAPVREEQLMTASLVIPLSMMGLGLFVLYTLSYLFFQQYALGLICVSTLLVLTITQSFLIFKLRRLDLAASVGLTLLFVSLTLQCLFSGGPQSPMLWWLIVFPVGATLMMSSRAGVSCGLMTLVAILGMIYYDQLVQPFGQPLTHAETTILQSITIISIMTVRLVTTAQYHEVRNQRQSVLEQQREELLSTVQSDLNKTQNMLVESAKLASIGEMAGGIAHEINNPLSIITVINERIQIAAEEDELDQQMVIDSCGKIQETTDRIARVVRRVRALAKDTRNDPFSIVNVNSLIEQTIELCQERFRNNGVQLIVGAFQDDVLLECRNIQVTQVLLNLLFNGFEAAKKNRQQEAWVQLDVNVTQKSVDFLITDSGAGISEENAQKVFSPFYSTKESTHGAGLGLNIAQKVAQEHGGLLYLDNNSPNTRFVFSISRDQDQAVA